MTTYGISVHKVKRKGKIKYEPYYTRFVEAKNFREAARKLNVSPSMMFGVGVIVHHDKKRMRKVS